jgi:hypothetical protein
MTEKKKETTDHKIGYIVFDVDTCEYIENPKNMCWTDEFDNAYLFENERDASIVAQYHGIILRLTGEQAEITVECIEEFTETVVSTRRKAACKMHPKAAAGK